MIQAKNKKNKLVYNFTDEAWKKAKENGLSEKYTVVGENADVEQIKAKINYTPPELMQPKG